MERERDIIVVGAGPSGATAATDLAQKGYDVLLLDRHRFPRDKACGDAIPGGAIDIMTRLGMGEKIDQAVDRGELYPLSQMRLVSPKGHLLEAKFRKSEGGSTSYVAPRVYYDAIIQEHAVDSGAEFCQAHVKEPLLDNGRVAGVKAQVNGSILSLRSRVVLDASGVTSNVMRAIRPKSGQHLDKHRAVALRAYIDDIEEHPHEVEFYLYKGILPGYAWIFPTGENQANIGLGMRLDHFRKLKRNLKQMLKDFMEMPAIKQRLKRGGEVRDVAVWQLNFGSQENLQHAFDGALLLGDAAGFINPLTGGGIHNALVSAMLATQTVEEALAKGDTSRRALQIYERRVHDALWDGMKRSYTLQRWLMRFPFVIDILVRRLNESSQLAQIFLTKL